MTDLTPDEILSGLRALVARAETDARAAENPVPQAMFGPFAPSEAPRIPDLSQRPGLHAPGVVANCEDAPGLRLRRL